MHTLGVRKLAVVLVAFAFLSSAWPAAAGPRRTADRPGTGMSVVEAVSAWLAGSGPNPASP